MKKNDLGFALIALIIIFPFLPFPFFSFFQKSFLYNESYWLITSFIKFFLLATMGEAIGLRIKKGRYNEPGFGLLPRALVWGGLGITIKIAFIVFAAGAPAFLEKSCGIQNAIESMKMRDIFAASENGLGLERLLASFSISTIMNLFYAPVMMTFHKITDNHIINTGGTLRGFFSPIKYGKNFHAIDWHTQWNFIFKRTIPFFWIPVQTINFMMPNEYRVVIAAVLGIALGIILSISSLKSKKQNA